MAKNREKMCEAAHTPGPLLGTTVGLSDLKQWRNGAAI
jgi:hypothetical protein